MILTSAPFLRKFSKIVVFSTLFLIFLGALIKSHEVGLSVPDWPSSYGYNMFTFPISQWVGGIFYEHGHRLFATIVGFLTLSQSLLIAFSNQPLWLKKTAFLALFLVILQGMLGGITVLFYLPPIVSMAHGVESRVPFVDVPLIVSMNSFPEDKRYHNKITKHVLKKIANQEENLSGHWSGTVFPAEIISLHRM